MWKYLRVSNFARRKRAKIVLSHRRREFCFRVGGKKVFENDFLCVDRKITASSLQKHPFRLVDVHFVFEKWKVENKVRRDLRVCEIN